MKLNFDFAVWQGIKELLCSEHQAAVLIQFNRVDCLTYGQLRERTRIGRSALTLQHELRWHSCCLPFVLTVIWGSCEILQCQSHLVRTDCDADVFASADEKLLRHAVLTMCLGKSRVLLKKVKVRNTGIFCCTTQRQDLKFGRNLPDIGVACLPFVEQTATRRWANQAQLSL